MPIDQVVIEVLNGPVTGAVAAKLVEKGYESVAELWRDAEDEVPEARLIAPDPRYAGPLLINGQFYQERDRLREMFKELLARGMDEARQNEAHPGFTDIVRQLSADEAAILDGIHSDTSEPGLNVRRFYERENQESWQLEQVELSGEVELQFHEKRRMYVEHLDELGLIEDSDFEGGRPSDLSAFMPFTFPGEVTESSSSDEGISVPNTATEYVAIVDLSEYGKSFMEACSPTEGNAGTQ